MASEFITQPEITEFRPVDQLQRTWNALKQRFHLTSPTETPVWLSDRRVRLRRWPAGRALVAGAQDAEDVQVGEVSLHHRTRLHANDFHQLQQVAKRLGLSHLVTPAVTTPEREVFEDLGFECAATLNVLRTNNRDIRPSRSGADREPKAKLAHTRQGDLDQIFSIDHASFEDPWRMDLEGFHDALRATPHARWRVARVANDVVGYAITGRNSSQGYLQRLAVSPSYRKLGIATLLVHDALHWLREHHAHETFVNTERSNIGARMLYESCGFSNSGDTLAVLTARVVDLRS